MIIDSIGQEVNIGDLCIIPWKSTKLTVGIFVKETEDSYIFDWKYPNKEAVKPALSSHIPVYKSIVNKEYRHFIKVNSEDLYRYIEV